MHASGIAREDMNKTTNIIIKVAALSFVIIGLISMIVAWDLLLISNIHSKTVLALEFGGVLVCMAGYFLWRRCKRVQSMPEEAGIKEDYIN